MHLVVDGHGGDYERLQNLDEVYQLLDRLPDRIEMTKIMPPYVFRYRGVKPEDWGVSGFVLIAESHIAIHTFPERGLVNVDVFSCKEFDTDLAVAMIRDTFLLDTVDIQVLARGLEYAEPPRALPVG
ncbi:MAG TPA: S-adenosylmethionine decarboxylase [Chloroflexota bacterium]|nr:S-adenosylmethionine decarboxylase [Chloroflexota bacterium]